MPLETVPQQVESSGQPDVSYYTVIQPSAAQVLCNQAQYLAVNTQLNSANRGYNLITKYPRADYVCIDEEEARMACQDPHGPLENLIESLAEQLHCRLMTVTRGYRGSITYQPGMDFVVTPVLARDVLETTGAGDAYLSITSPCACMEYSAELVGFEGNAVGALAVCIIGNKESVEPAPLDQVRQHTVEIISDNAD